MGLWSSDHCESQSQWSRDRGAPLLSGINVHFKGHQEMVGRGKKSAATVLVAMDLFFTQIKKRDTTQMVKNMLKFVFSQPGEIPL